MGDGYKRPLTGTTVAPMVSVAEYGAARKLTQVGGSLLNPWTAANAGRKGQIQDGVSHMNHNALDFTKGSNSMTSHDGNEIVADKEMNPRGRDETSQQDAAELARKLLRYERMQYMNDDASYESSGDEDYLMVPPPPPPPCE